METKSLVQERVSVFADGETSDEQLDIALADLRNAEGKASWELYHQIGDLLRSDEMAVPMSAGFAASMAARLAAEPALVAPVLPARARKTGFRRMALPGVLAAAAAAVAFVGTPQLMVAMHGGPGSGATVAVVSDSGVSRTALNVNSARAGAVLRDQGIDEYLMAHQRFSPSVYSSAQYARSATFANESGK
ncbi:sigma-E factor negative regulatory protein [Noviherbaspirillum suwonense]|uniref:Anti sigma-E protein, RseA n=1 Tax=Noviherbaspirillum suwonense TaxID=1224511 RepID=A0ABY1QIP5_9BURK|nr:sigma-E factor negative regulatory protein [Noviherbaspirillum suwonense]SMP69698.1 anti sigma-E protein, RseA [Noviherbaspirillum suwonense]